MRRHGCVYYSTVNIHERMRVGFGLYPFLWVSRKWWWVWVAKEVGGLWWRWWWWGVWKKKQKGLERGREESLSSWDLQNYIYRKWAHQLRVWGTEGLCSESHWSFNSCLWCRCGWVLSISRKYNFHISIFFSFFPFFFFFFLIKKNYFLFVFSGLG